MIFPEQFRVGNPNPYYRSSPGDGFGIFLVPSGSDQLFCLGCDGLDTGWDHVSISVRNKRGLPLKRCPDWEQMCLVKSLFWTDDEVAIQIHPKKADHVNNHAYCLHLWRCLNVSIPFPGPELVGIKSIGTITA